MRKENTFNQGLDENLICRSIEFFATQKIGMTLFFCLLSGVAHAQCVPTPDCGELGYTATSCEGGFIRCPFDTSKLYCVPCDSAYKYTCTNTGEVGKGNSCNGKYIECGCTDGYELNGGNCVVSCAYSRTTLPTGCSSADSCNKNGTTYYSSTCITCSNGYTLSSGSCTANSCSGYHTDITGCSSYSTCLSGSTTKYWCTACESGYTLCEGNGTCIDEYCYTNITGNGVECHYIQKPAVGSDCGNKQCVGNDGLWYANGPCSSPSPF